MTPQNRKLAFNSKLGEILGSSLHSNETQRRSAPKITLQTHQARSSLHTNGDTNQGVKLSEESGSTQNLKVASEAYQTQLQNWATIKVVSVADSNTVMNQY